MNRYDFAARLSLCGFTALVPLLFAAFVIEPKLNTEAFSAMQLAGFIVTALATVPSLYLWVTGFSRYRGYLGFYGLRFVLYAGVFTILYAVYIQLKYRNEFGES